MKIKCERIDPALFYDERVVVVKMACTYKLFLLVAAADVDEDALTLEATMIHVYKDRFDIVRVRVDGVEDTYEFDIRKGAIVHERKTS